MITDSDPLAKLRDIALPEGVSWWPLAPGWWLLLFLMILTILVVRRWYQRKSNGHWRIEALEELQSIRNLKATSGCEFQALEKLSALFRRVAIQIAGRKTVASLTGVSWLEKLDQLNGNKEFTKGAGRLLETVVWQKPKSLDATEIDQLVTLLEDFIKKSPNSSNVRQSVIKGDHA